jgi:hypothetical protein
MNKKISNQGLFLKNTNLQALRDISGTFTHLFHISKTGLN